MICRSSRKKKLALTLFGVTATDADAVAAIAVGRAAMPDFDGAAVAVLCVPTAVTPDELLAAGGCLASALAAAPGWPLPR